ncbi:hypothetical protein Ga0080559_TMP538 [Salipiger profundus]|uniref:Uncharacterized protein n=1 Tax=Salipiger profundus TaxID=1229727 RepID=A0A1U7CZK1_9RHOB|nr:hypothetical protein Ga0080559_TMP538 [Salipiger profundus]
MSHACLPFLTDPRKRQGGGEICSRKGPVVPPRTMRTSPRTDRPFPVARPARGEGDHPGRSPDLRVVASLGPSRAFTQWHVADDARRSQLRGQSRVCTAFPILRGCRNQNVAGILKRRPPRKRRLGCRGDPVRRMCSGCTDRAPRCSVAALRRASCRRRVSDSRITGISNKN